MNFTPKKPLSVRNRILDAIVERLKNVVNGTALRFSPASASSFLKWVVTGQLNGVTPRSFTLTFKVGGNVEIVEKTKDGEVSSTPVVQAFTPGTPLVILDSGVSIDYDPLSGSHDVDDVVEIRMNLCNSTIRDVVRWDKIGQNLNYPSAVVYPHREWKKHFPSDRYQSQLKVYITLWYEQEPDDVSWFEEFLADCQDELMRDIQFGQCLNYDSSIDEITVVDGENSTERVGALLECSIFYRNSDTTTRVPRN